MWFRAWLGLGLAISLTVCLGGCATHRFPIESARSDAVPVALSLCAESEFDFVVRGAELHGSTLYVELELPAEDCGGSFSACWSSTVMASLPPQHGLNVRYLRRPERCESGSRTRVLAIDLGAGRYRVSRLGERSVVLFEFVEPT